MRYDSEYYGICSLSLEEYLQHHGIKGQKWGIRRFQNKDGTLTTAGRERYLTDMANKYNLVDVPKNRDAAWDNAGDMVLAKAPKKEVKKYLEVNDLDPKEYGRLKKEMQPYVERQKLRDKTQKSNAKAIEKGNFDLKNDNRAQYLKDEITKTYSDYKKSVDEFEKKYSKEREAFYKDSKLFEKYQRKVAEEEWPSSGWKNTTEEKKRWIDMFLYEDFGQNDEAFEKYMRETGKGKKYEKDVHRNYEANDRFNKSISDYVDHVLGEHKNTPVKDIYFSKWDEKKRKWVPKDTTAGKLLNYKIMVSEMSSKKW